MTHEEVRTMLDVRAELERKMSELQITGSSTMGQFTDQQRLVCVNEIDRIVNARKANAGAVMSKEPGRCNAPS
jgi:hypothetical protein